MPTVASSISRRILQIIEFYESFIMSMFNAYVVKLIFKNSIYKIRIVAIYELRIEHISVSMLNIITLINLNRKIIILF